LKMILKEYGFKVPNGHLVGTGSFGAPIRFPAVLKVVDTRIPHKTEAGAIKLWIKDSNDLEDQIELMHRRFPNYQLMVEEMLFGGLEIISGLYNDRNFGLTIMFGMGGIFTELYNDISFRAVPINFQDASEMVAETSVVKFTRDGFRNIKVDMHSLCDFLVKLSNFAVDNMDCIQQLDLNPVLANQDGEVILDAKVIGIP
ncbi:MAG: acetate--CoA ligase family protein, partial [Thermoplasmataceae archaeon]